jgi:hypothetical protein
MDPSSSPSANIQRFAGLAFGALAQTVNTMLVQFEHLLLCPPCRGLGVAIARGLLGFSCIHGLRILLRNMRENTQARDGLAHLPMIMRRCSFPQRSPVEGNREVFNQDRKRCVGRHLASTTQRKHFNIQPIVPLVMVPQRSIHGTRHGLAAIMHQADIQAKSLRT